MRKVMQMIGIEVGATEITQSTGGSIPLDRDAMPPDLLTRIAHDRPYVRLADAGATVCTSHDIYAALVADSIWPHELGDESDPVAVAVPGWWSPSARARVDTALAERGVRFTLVNDAEAAVAEYLHTGHELPEDVVVVNLRAELASAVIVQSSGDVSGAPTTSTTVKNPTALVTPTLVHDEGGSDLDAAVLRHLLHGLHALGEGVDTADPAIIAAARTVLPHCAHTRETLSMSARESVRPDLPGVHQQVLLVRSELEELATPWVDAVIGIVHTAIEQHTEHIDAVLLTGGLAAMPLISQRLSADLALDVHVPAAPRLVVARGAARLATHRTAPVPHRRSFMQWLTRRAAHFPLAQTRPPRPALEPPVAAFAIEPPTQEVDLVERDDVGDDTAQLHLVHAPANSLSPTPKTLVNQ